MSDVDWFQPNAGLCAWSFQCSAESPYADPFMERMKFLLDNVGLYFSDDSDVSAKLAEKISTQPQHVSSDEWDIAGGFLEVDRGALIKLQTGHVAFSAKETEAMEETYSRFFLLDGRPRHAPNHYMVMGQNRERAFA